MSNETATEATVSFAGSQTRPSMEEPAEIRTGSFERFWGDVKLLRIAFVAAVVLAVFAVVFGLVQLARSRRAPRSTTQTTLNELGFGNARASAVGLPGGAPLLQYRPNSCWNLENPNVVAGPISSSSVTTDATKTFAPPSDTSAKTAPFKEPRSAMPTDATSGQGRANPKGQLTSGDGTVMGENSRNRQRRGDSEGNAALDRDMREASWRKQPKESSVPFPQSQREDQWTKGSTPLDETAPTQSRGYAV